MMVRISVILLLVIIVLTNGCITIQPVSTSDEVTVLPAPSESIQTVQPDVPKRPTTVEGDINAPQEIGAYRLKPMDTLYVRFSGVRELQPLEVVIDENGKVKLPHLDPITVVGMTTSEFERAAEKAYIESGIYKNISINITMTSKTYFIQGEVNSPGQMPLQGGTTLLQAIAAARGYTPYANKRKITVTRAGKIYTYNAKELEKNPTKDIKIEAGDMIKVWQSIW